jgi:hypothetical protein
MGCLSFMGDHAWQVTLALRRLQQCEEFLALATLLSSRDDSGAINHGMRVQLHRCYAQLYSSQARWWKGRLQDVNE